jgi:hypothetical protein
VLVCDDLQRASIGQAAELRWSADAGQLRSMAPSWWMLLPSGPEESKPMKQAVRPEPTRQQAAASFLAPCHSERVFAACTASRRRSER